ncbi:hypothetical protein [Streptomyces monashensis]|uniref:Uncharacterized protein n=1 Tax=Streptomyces monashensis TaxID=1678012 RepID=A0A1S2QHS7_9ACTN|nr:hypothetical protein [Streptomyces monashensis]OIK05710.1 hypothetical protein BIV23_10260 [Streptomyces monashensis]
MSSPDAEAWAEALAMYEERYSYVLVGPRAHGNWVRDVAALMRREVADPRSWKWVDVDEGEEERLDDPVFPFVLPPAEEGPEEEWRDRLLTVPRVSVKRLLVMLATTWLNVPREIIYNDFERRRPELERKAGVILSRFPEETVFYTNSGVPGSDNQSRSDVPDFYGAITGCAPVSQYDWDLGLVAVSSAEVGLFWSFDAT